MLKQVSLSQNLGGRIFFAHKPRSIVHWPLSNKKYGVYVSGFSLTKCAALSSTLFLSMKIGVIAAEMKKCQDSSKPLLGHTF